MFHFFIHLTAAQFVSGEPHFHWNHKNQYVLSSQFSILLVHTTTFSLNLAHPVCMTEDFPLCLDIQTQTFQIKIHTVTLTCPIHQWSWYLMFSESIEREEYWVEARPPSQSSLTILPPSPLCPPAAHFSSSWLQEDIVQTWRDTQSCFMSPPAPGHYIISWLSVSPPNAPLCSPACC